MSVLVNNKTQDLNPHPTTQYLWLTGFRLSRTHGRTTDPNRVHGVIYYGVGFTGVGLEVLETDTLEGTVFPKTPALSQFLELDPFTRT